MLNFSDDALVCILNALHTKMQITKRNRFKSEGNSRAYDLTCECYAVIDQELFEREANAMKKEESNG